MRTHSRSNSLLVELLIVILFFMLSAAVLIQVFGKARSLGTRAETVAAAIMDAQNTADRMIASEDPERELAGMGFVQAEGRWVLETDSWRIEAVTEPVPAGSGRMIRQTVQVFSADGEELLNLPCSRYEEAAE